MMTPVPPDRLTALIVRAEERLNRSHQLLQQIEDSLLQAREATWWSRELLAQDRDEGPQQDDQAGGDSVATGLNSNRRF
jgi:hypothetical protein